MVAGPDDVAASEAGSDRIREMIAYLDRLTELYRRFLDLGKRKERCLINAELAELDALVREEQQLVHEATQLEARRFRLQTQLAGELGCPGETLTASRLLAAVSDDDGRRLLQAQEQLAQVLKQVGEQNELNAALIEQFLAYTDFVLKALQGVTRQTYDPQGRVDAAPGRQPRVFDRKV